MDSKLLKLQLDHSLEHAEMSLMSELPKVPKTEDPKDMHMLISIPTKLLQKLLLWLDKISMEETLELILLLPDKEAVIVNIFKFFYFF